MRVLITPTSLCKNQHSLPLTGLRNLGYELVFNKTGRPLTSDELCELLPGIDGVIAGLDHYNRTALASGENLKVISRYGVGLNNVDLLAAEELGITVTNTPGANSASVAELAAGLILSVARTIPTSNSDVKAGQWPRATGLQLSGKTLGILGLGAIGCRLAQIARGMGMHVIGSDPAWTAEKAESQGIELVEWDGLLRRSNVLSLHLPLLESTRGIVGANELAALPAGAIVINTARGGLIDEPSLLDAIETGHIWGAGLDAYESEPPIGNKLVQHPRVVTTPHSGAHTDGAIDRMTTMAIDNLVKVLQN